MCLILCGQSIGCLSAFHVNVKLIWPCQERRWLPRPHPYRSVAMVTATILRAKWRRLRQMSDGRSASPIMFTGLSAGLIMGCLIKTTAFGGGSDKVTVDWRWHPVSLAVSRGNDERRFTKWKRLTFEPGVKQEGWWTLLSWTWIVFNRN